jgi:5-methylthioribose kinase
MIWSSYQTAHANLAPPPFREVSRYAGIEVLRRTIGAARVPAVERDETALAALETGARLVTSPPEQPESFC